MRCNGCGKAPHELPCYTELLREMLGRIPTEEEAATYVQGNEGTYNSSNGHFLCDGCYIKAGMPSAPGGWIAP